MAIRAPGVRSPSSANVSSRGKRVLAVRPRHATDLTKVEDIWDFLNQRCPLSKLEARVLLERYILGKGELALAQEMGVPWRRLNRATWRMKAKLRYCINEYPKVKI